jgi:UPF0755 protein
MGKKIKTVIIILFLGLALLVAGFFYFRYQVYYSHGSYVEGKTIKIEKGEGNKSIGEKLEKEKIISGKYYFYYYMWSKKLTAKILPDEYELSAKMTIPEVIFAITQEQDKNIKITFPEGWTSKQMAERLTANGLPGGEFSKIISNPGDLKSQYAFLTDSGIKTLEGYLFPDTYFFTSEMDAQMMVRKMLGIFNTKVTSQMKADAMKNGKSLNDIMVMASIIEGEVRTDEDRKIVSGIFWNRIKNGQALQSCATLAYITGENKKQYSELDTKINSPFNTYLVKGLPPAPISNPGLSAINAAIYPTETQYNYFLSDPQTGKTVFSKTYEEHVANKAKYGL